MPAIDEIYREIKSRDAAIPITLSDLSARTGYSIRTVQRHLRALKLQGRISYRAITGFLFEIKE